MERVDRKRYQAILQDPERRKMVREMLAELSRKGKIARPHTKEEYDLRAVFSHHITPAVENLRDVQWAITLDTIFIWGHDGNETFRGNWDLFKRVSAQPIISL